MKALTLDPPHRLRLVSSQAGPGPERDHRYRQAASLGADARRLYRETLRRGLERGSPIDPDALRVVLVAKQTHHAEPLRRFTATSIWQLMFVDVVSWCRARRLTVPPGATDALRALVDHLAESDTLAPGSDTLAELETAIDECTGGWADDDPPSLPARRRSVRSQRGPKA